MDNKIFADGFFYKPRSDNAPTYIIGGITVDVAKAIAFLQTHNTNKGQVRLDIKKAINGKHYMELNTFKIEPPAFIAKPAVAPAPEVDDTQIPF